MSSKTRGELLFEEYLVTQQIEAKHEPTHSHTNRRPDFVIAHPIAGDLIVEVKDIYVAPPRSSGVMDMYRPIRSHIDAAREQFNPFKNHICVLVLMAAEGSFIDLSNPTSMLGAMYGSLGFTLPFDPELGRFDSSQIKREFIVGDGKMVRRTHNQHTRISAILTLHHYNIQAMRYSRHAKTPGGYAELMNDSISFPEEKGVGVTVWENAVASKPLPRDLFRGPLDQWWSFEGDAQELSYVGDRLRELREAD
jgi:hypothetical protein